MRTSERVKRLSALIRSPRLSRFFICSFHLYLVRFHPSEPSTQCARRRAPSLRRRPQGAPPRAPRRIGGGRAGGDDPRELVRELRARDAAPHASLTSPLSSPLFTAATRVSEVGRPMRSHAPRMQRPHAGGRSFPRAPGEPHAEAGGVELLRRRSCCQGRRGGAPRRMAASQVDGGADFPRMPHPRAAAWAAELASSEPPLHPWPRHVGREGPASCFF
jgi:hypothetical protein